jgi:DNA-binding LytR/AlgR family response regulator
MRIGICDDSEQSRKVVSNWLKTRPDVIESGLFEFSSGEALLEHLRRFSLDMVFMDCQMDGMDCIETAKAIRKSNSSLVIILLTGFQGYAIYGYGADVFDFILKKNFSSKAGEVFERAVQRVKTSALKKYTVKTGSGLLTVDISDVLYIESHRRKKEIFIRDGKSYEFYGKIEDIEQDLRKHGFIRPHNSFLVNSCHIKVLTAHSVWLSGLSEPLPVSKGKYKQAYDDLTVFATEARL